MGGLIAAALELATRQLQQAKAAGIAILVHLLFRDHTLNQNIIITGNFIIEQFIEKLWILPTYKYECLVGLVASMVNFVGRWPDRAFVDSSVRLTNTLTAICRILEAKSIPYVLQVTPQVCTLFRALPAQLIFWLNAAVKMAIAQGLAPLAFEFQLRVVTVIWLTLYELKDREVLRFDLSSLTQGMEKIDLSQYAHRQLQVVAQAEEISVPGLEAALQGAIQIGEAAGMVQEAEALKAMLSQARLR
jgi:hypothetical protein